MGPDGVDPLKYALDEATSHRMMLEEEMQDLTARLNAANEEVIGLQRAIDRRSPVNRYSRLVEMHRTDAVAEVLRRRTAGDPATPGELMEALHAEGRDDSYEAVGAALAHLSRTGRAHTLTRGQWVVGPGPETAALIELEQLLEGLDDDPRQPRDQEDYF